MALCAWALTDAAGRLVAPLALFSSFSKTLFIPPCRKYSWQTLDETKADTFLPNEYDQKLKYASEAPGVTCDTTQCGSLLHSFWSSGYQRDSSWPRRTRSASARPHSAHARSFQSRPLKKDDYFRQISWLYKDFKNMLMLQNSQILQRFLSSHQNNEPTCQLWSSV